MNSVKTHKIIYKKKGFQEKTLPKYPKPTNEKNASIIKITTSPNIPWRYHR